METKSPVPRAILVGVQVPGVDDAAHAGSLAELSRLVKTLGYEVVAAGTPQEHKADQIECTQAVTKGGAQFLILRPVRPSAAVAHDDPAKPYSFTVPGIDDSITIEVP